MKKFVFLSVLFFSLFGAFAQSQRLFVTDIDVEAISESQIKIRWTLPQNLDTEKDVLSIAIYRTNIPVSDVSALWNEKPLALLHGFETEYIDTVSEKKEFFYEATCLGDRFWFHGTDPCRKSVEKHAENL